jgi:phage portal protein BeeE
MQIPILSRFFKARDKLVSNSLFGSAYTFFFGGSTSGKTVNERTAMQTTAVYACVRVLSETLASLPLQIYKRTERGKEKAINHKLY